MILSQWPGLHHLVYEIVDNSIDEALAGHCDKITVELLPGEIIRVRDDLSVAEEICVI